MVNLFLLEFVSFLHKCSLSVFILFFDTVSQSLSNIRAANNTLNNIETISKKHNEKFRKWNETIGSQLQELRDKIAKARHAAEGVSFN